MKEHGMNSNMGSLGTIVKIIFGIFFILALLFAFMITNTSDSPSESFKMYGTQFVADPLEGFRMESNEFMMRGSPEACVV